MLDYILHINALCRIIMVISIVAPHFSIWKPSKNLTKFGLMGLSKNIFISNDSPSIQSFSFSMLDLFYIGVIAKIFDHWT